MISNEFAEASAELNMLFQYVPNEYIEKIPRRLRDFFIKVESKTYQPTINPNQTLEEQNIKEKTKDLIAIIYRNYWCNEEERKELDQKIIENDKKYEEELSKKYNPDNLFNKNKNIEQEEIYSEKEVSQNIAMVEYKESIFKRIINKIRRIFHFN
jgi:hypothetical protein